MPKLTFDELLEAIKCLTIAEQQRLKELRDLCLIRNHSQSTEDEFEQELYEAGLLSEIKSPITDFAPYQDRKLGESKGKLLSEVIIEARR